MIGIYKCRASFCKLIWDHYSPYCPDCGSPWYDKAETSISTLHEASVSRDWSYSGKNVTSPSNQLTEDNRFYSIKAS